MARKENKIIIVLSLALIISLVFHFKDKKTFVPFDDTELRNTIKTQQNIIDLQNKTIMTVQAKRDTFFISETKVKHYYHEIYTFNADASSLELDSVIRANW